MYDLIREARTKKFLASVSEDERDLCMMALGCLDDEDNRTLFWAWVKRIQQVTKLPKDEARELLNFMIDDFYE